MKKNITIYSLLVAFLAMTLVACNKKDDDPQETVVYGTSTSSTLVTDFSLKANAKILANLDSVKFSIDQEKGTIYNVDSLPVGTKITRLLTTVTFGSTVGSAEYVIKSEKQDTTIKYSDSSTDSIDFSGNVVLNVKSADGTFTRSYRVMVNVHKVEPDTLIFPMAERRNLPASADENYSVGMACLGGTYYTVVNNSNGRYVGTSTTPAGPWDTEKLTVPFTPVEKTLTATSEALYMLDDAGNMFTSTDGKNWTATDKAWKNILGGYGDRVLGIVESAGTLYFDEYPAAAGHAVVEVPANFPVSMSSQLIMTANDWTIHSMAMLVGGRLADGTVTDAAWGYDGTAWGEISYPGVKRLPKLEGATLYSYYTYEQSKVYHSASKKITWLVMGGRLADGKYNRTTYMSRDQGINWVAAGAAMDIHEYMPSCAGALAFVCNETFTVAKAPKRVTKPVTEWECPYVYLVGGFDSNGTLLNNVWKGTITRMTFKPTY